MTDMGSHGSDDSAFVGSLIGSLMVVLKSVYTGPGLTF
jgi:hypothetical protein